MPPITAPRVPDGPSETVGPHEVFLADAKQDYNDLLMAVDEVDEKLKKARKATSGDKKVDLVLNDVLVDVKKLLRKMVLGMSGLHEANIEAWELAAGESSLVTIEDAEVLHNVFGNAFALITEMLDNAGPMTPEQRKKADDVQKALMFGARWLDKHVDADDEDGDGGGDDEDEDDEDDDEDGPDGDGGDDDGDGGTHLAPCPTNSVLPSSRWSATARGWRALLRA